MNDRSVVLDSNILFSLLLRRGARARRILFANSDLVFHRPKFLVVELFKHKERIAEATNWSEVELLECLHEILARVHFLDEPSIPLGIWVEARRLCRDVDPKDTPFVALALHLEGRLWTEDDELKRGLAARGFTHFFAM